MCVRDVKFSTSNEPSISTCWKKFNIHIVGVLFVQRIMFFLYCCCFNILLLLYSCSAQRCTRTHSTVRAHVRASVRNIYRSLYHSLEWIFIAFRCQFPQHIFVPSKRATSFLWRCNGKIIVYFRFLPTKYILQIYKQKE